MASAQASLSKLVQRRCVRQLELAISGGEEGELKGAMSDARAAGVAVEVIDRAKATLRQALVRKAARYLEDAQEAQEEERLRDAIIEARKLELPPKEIEKAQGALNEPRGGVFMR